VKDSNGKWALIDKKAGGSSPDNADAFLLTFGGVRGSNRGRFTKNKNKSTISLEAQYGQGSASYLNQGSRIWQ